MMLRFAAVLAMLSGAAIPVSAQAQGLVGGAERGYHAGDRALGPVGGLVGGAVGAGIGTVNGALGIPRYFFYHGRRCYYRFHHRHCI